MDIKNMLSVKNRDELREWLQKNYQTEKECWIQVKRGRPTDENAFWYIDAVEEALCFGWIDSTTKRFEGKTFQRLAPRSKRSVWSELNKARFLRMEKLGRMTDVGRRVLTTSKFEIDAEILQALQQDEEVWRNFQKFPPLYRQVRIDTIQIKKKNNPKLYLNRLNKFIENTKNGVMYGEWNDNGRLSDL
ncbi:MAG: YdeI/OmpD-associated family protein [Corallococcus sp.]|nr:YdeI/OmpD-associated family protein [Corallococcus sp.]MCM1359800.1 YdeI/OmpD-associated family protein [Corallococcus sp.]MCM1395674.1 YdeI/OmpD-associated family protein [Corallococcus sp.]